MKEVIYLRHVGARCSDVRAVCKYAKGKQLILKTHMSDIGLLGLPWQERMLGMVVEKAAKEKLGVVIYDIVEQVSSMRQVFSLCMTLAESEVTLHIIKQGVVVEPDNYNKYLCQNLTVIEAALRESSQQNQQRIIRPINKPYSLKVRKLDYYKDEIIGLVRENNISRQELAKRYQVNIETVASWCRINGIHTRRPRKLDKYRDDIIRMLRKGEPINRIAIFCKVHENTVKKYIHDEGLKE